MRGRDGSEDDEAGLFFAMNFRSVGRSGLVLSEIGLGSYLTYGDSVDFERSKKCIHKAFELGVNFFDTADVYAKGEAERFLGKALKDFERGRVVIGTKCYFPVSEDPNDRGLSRKHIRESVDRSLKNLQVEYLDLLQCHRFDPGVSLEETVRALSDLVQQGKVLYWGVSRWSVEQVEEAIRLADRTNGYRPVSNQVPYNLLYRAVERDLLPACPGLGMGVLAYAPLAQGVLTGKYCEGKIPEGSRASDSRFISRLWEMKPDSLSRADRLRSVAEQMGVTPAQLSIAWCLRQGVVSSVIIGATSPSQVEENLKASGLRLPEQALKAMEKIVEAVPAVEGRNE